MLTGVVVECDKCRTNVLLKVEDFGVEYVEDWALVRNRFMCGHCVKTMAMADELRKEASGE